MKKKNTILLIFAILLSVAGCVKEKIDSGLISKTPDIETTVATPIGYVKNTLLEIFAPQIDSGILSQDENGMLWFKFNQAQDTFNVSDIIQYPDFDTTYAIINNTGLPIDLNAAGTQIQISQVFYCDFGYSQGSNGEIIDSLLLNNMNMDVDVLASGVLNASLNATFPGISYNNLAYSKDLVVSSSNSFSDLMAYTVHLENSSANKNQLKISITLDLSQTNRIIAPGEKMVDIGLHFSAIDFQILYGYIGQIAITPPQMQETTINLMNNMVSGYFNFDHSYIELSTKNSFGVPFSFNLDNFEFQTFYTPTGSMVFENIAIPSSKAEISFPNMTQIGQSIDGNSTIDAGHLLLGFQDYYSTLSGSLSGTSNPEGQKDYNFVLKNSQLEISTSYSVPFWGNTDNLFLTDTINFDLSGYFQSTIDKINRLLFIVNFTNALPMDAETQIYFYNAAGAKLDSMFNPSYLITGSSKANDLGKVSPEPNAPVKVEFLADRIQGLTQTNYLLVVSKIKTIDVDSAPPVSWKFFSDYYFYTHIGVAATFNQ